MSRKLLLPVVAGSLLLGCYDPQEKFDEFAERDKALHRPVKQVEGLPPPPATCTRTDGNTKTFLLTIAPVISPNQVSMVKMTITATSGGTAMNITAQTYANDHQTLVGPVTNAGPIPINADGTFQTDVLSLALPAEANCILGTPVTTEVQLKGGYVCDDATFACGTMTGRVVEVGLDLAGSTWSAQEMPEGSPIPAPLLDCARTAVDPAKAACVGQ
jgi:hypothetical protein